LLIRYDAYRHGAPRIVIIPMNHIYEGDRYPEWIFLDYG
jgi:hypothetical protein